MSDRALELGGMYRVAPSTMFSNETITSPALTLTLLLRHILFYAVTRGVLAGAVLLVQAIMVFAVPGRLCW